MRIDYTLYQQNIFRLLKEGLGGISGDAFFYDCLAPQIAKVAAHYGCEASISVHRMQQGRSHWVDDMRALGSDRRIQGDNPVPDHIKHSAFLCYWLRRRVVIDFVRDTEPYEDPAFQEEFVTIFGPELIVFDICFRLCLYHHLAVPSADEGSLIQNVQNFRLDRGYMREVAIFLHHKNVSPHSLYLVLKTLMMFAPRGAQVISLVR